VQDLILERFDAASAAAAPPSNTSSKPSPSPAPKANGHAKKVKLEGKVKNESEDEDNNHDETPPPKKKRKQEKPVKEEMDDAELAAMLQAQEDGRARPTRGGVKRKTPVKKRAPKKKSADKVKGDDDSELELDSDGEVKEKPKKGGFHKQYNLSAPLADLVGEATVSEPLSIVDVFLLTFIQLSRPQVVKKIWQYIKARDLQDPADKRQIRCDDKLQLVFKQV
jgi:chromatin remodeling complex protein RSC6